MIIFDAFCFNGSTWIDKDFFNSNNVIKNDLRVGKYIVGGRQNIFIKPNCRLDMFRENSCIAMEQKIDIIYLDPPHSLKTTGIMNEKYTHLPENWITAINNMWKNVCCLSNHNLNSVIILKWNENEISINTILKIAIANHIYPLFGSKIRTKTYWIVLHRVV